MRDEIIDFYPTNENEVIKTILEEKRYLLSKTYDSSYIR